MCKMASLTPQPFSYAGLRTQCSGGTGVSFRPIMQNRESCPNRKTISEPFGIFQKLQINFLASRHMSVNASKKNLEKILIFVGSTVGELELVLGL